MGMNVNVKFEILKQVQDGSLIIKPPNSKRHAELVSASHRKSLTFSLN